MDKNELRIKYKKIRTNIKEKDLKNKVILNKVINNIHFISSKMIAIYVSFNDEVDTINIIKECFKLKKRVCVPVTYKDEMKFYEIKALSDLRAKNKLGILEPTVEGINPIKNIDLFIIPGLCYDKNNNRVGYGGGYYDKYLKNYKNTYKLGIFYSEQITHEAIEIEKTDIILDEIITD